MIPDENVWRQPVWEYAKRVFRSLMDLAVSLDGPGVRIIVIDLDDLWSTEQQQQDLNDRYRDDHRLSRFQYDLSVMDIQLDYVPTLTRFELKGFLGLGPDSVTQLKEMMPRLSEKGIVYVTAKAN